MPKRHESQRCALAWKACFRARRRRPRRQRRTASAPDTTETPADAPSRTPPARKPTDAAAPSVADTPRPSTGAKPPRLGRATQRWTPPAWKSVTRAQDAAPFQRREVRGGRDVVQPRPRDDNIPGVVNFASNPRTFATGGAIVALSFVLYASVFLSGMLAASFL